MGPVPFLDPSGLTDATGTLGPERERKVNRARDRFHQQFPQCKVHVVIKTFRDDMPLDLALFWIFNSAGLSAADRVGGRNHDLLIGIDPHRMLVGATMGYGLEAFICSEEVDHNLARAAPQLEAGDFAAGVITIIEGFSESFATACQRLPIALGLREPAPDNPALAVADY